MRHPLPAKNVRPVVPRVCATCAYGLIDDGAFLCYRQGGHSSDTGDNTYWLTVCDRYEADPPKYTIDDYLAMEAARP